MFPVQIQTYDWVETTEFQQMFGRWNLDENVAAYQVLEFILRQALMDESVAGYNLGVESRLSQISIKSGIESYVSKILTEIQAIEARKSDSFKRTTAVVQRRNELQSNTDAKLSLTDSAVLLKEFGSWYHEPIFWLGNKLADGKWRTPTTVLSYGFEKLILRGIFSDETSAEQIEQMIADEPVASNKERTLFAQIKSSFSSIGRTAGKYMRNRLSDGHIVLFHDKHDFFKYYIAVSEAVFLPYFRELAGGDNHRYYEFLAAKFKHMLCHDPQLAQQGLDITPLTRAKTLSQRAKQNRKFQDQIADQIQSLGLTNNGLFPYLSRLQVNQ